MQIKVTDTKMHSYKFKENEDTNYYRVGVNVVPVTEGKLILVECTYKEGLLWKRNIDDKFFNLATGVAVGKTNNIYYKPIIISETEKIEVGDWYLHYNSGTKEYTLFRADSIFENGNNPNDIDLRGNILPYGNKKVLALPEHFSPKHLQAIVDGKMKDGDKVLIECENIGYYSHNDDKTIPLDKGIKLNSSNHIILHKIEEKMYNEKDVILIVSKFIRKELDNKTIHFFDRMSTEEISLHITKDLQKLF
jgi:hypothetical protein